MPEQRTVARFVFLSVVALFGTILGLALLAGTGFNLGPEAFLFAAIAAGLERFSTRLFGNLRASASPVGVIAAALTAGVAGAALAAVAVALAASLRRGRPFSRVAFNTGQQVIAAVAAALVIAAARSWLGQTAGNAAGAVLAGGVMWAIPGVLVTTMVALDTGAEFGKSLRRNLDWLAAHFMVAGVVGLALAVAWSELGLLGVAAFVLPAVGIVLSLKQGVAKSRRAVADATLAEAEAVRLQHLLEEHEALMASAPVAILAFDTEGLVTSSEGLVEELVGLSASRLSGRTLATARPDWESSEAVARALSGSPTSLNLIGSNDRTMQASLQPVLGPTGDVTRVIAVFTDVTQQARMEEQLQRSQRLEAVGTLAGGISHDFNNILTVINGYAEMALSSGDLNDTLEDQLSAISEAGGRAATLTKQLLNFSRFRMAESRSFSINDVVADTATMLRRVIGGDIKLTTTLDPTVKGVLGDTGQFEQVVMNLAINARDAMPSGGRLDVTTRTEFKDGREFAVLSVRDNGSGMPDDVADHMFEPYYTTKDRAGGSGIGLSTVHGIVAQGGGAIDVQSTVGEGTDISIFLPVVCETGDSGTERRPAIATASRTILVAEDEPVVRKFVADVLRSEGFSVIDDLSTPDLTTGIAPHLPVIDLAIVTPSLRDRQGGMAHLVDARGAPLEMLFLSDDTDDPQLEHLRGRSLVKPFTSEALLAKVQALLVGSRNTGTAPTCGASLEQEPDQRRGEPGTIHSV